MVAAEVGLKARLKRLLDDPVSTISRRMRAQRPDATQPAPALDLFHAYGGKSRAAGIDRLHLFLSFDCDTDLDIAASTELHRFLASLGIKMTMAVPGTQLGNGAVAYGRLAAAGVEFINHGFLPHAAWEHDRYVSATFYHDMPQEAVREDIRRGHHAVRDIIGSAPLGFRAPHFGHFQQPEQLDLVYGMARELGYRYCSTTSPTAAYDRGPIYDVGGLVELPTSGSVRAPTTILDSWTYLTDRRDYVLANDYAELMMETVDVLLANNIAGIMSWYADPAHVIGQAPFERAMRHIAECKIGSLMGREAAALGRRR
tara:strand:+ start:9742 stop:10683 length:942 start_codon:yes stop_codon:yes gene_type:complete